MVLVSNEWQNKSEDEQKSSANSNAAADTSSSATNSTGTAAVPPIAGATTTTAVAITSTIQSPATATIVNTDISSCSITTTDGTAIAPAVVVVDPSTFNDSQKVCKTLSTSLAAATAATETTLKNNKALEKQKGATASIRAANDNNNEQQQQQRERQRHLKDKFPTTDTVQNNKQQQRLENDNNEKSLSFTPGTTTNNNFKEDQYIASVLNQCNKKIMAENAKEMPLKEEELTVDPLVADAASFMNSHNNTDNNKSQQQQQQQQPSVTVKTQNIQNTETSQQQQKHYNAAASVSVTGVPPPPPPNRTEFIKSGLRTVINSMKTNSPTTAAAGLQPNFLSQLELTDDVTVLRAATFRQIGSPFKTGSETNSRSTIDESILDISVSDSTAVNSSSNSVNNTINTNTTTVPNPSESSNNGQAKILLICEGTSHPFQARTILLTPNVECMVGRLIAKSKAAENNAIFDCKVLSRKHAVIWYTPDGKFWVKDTKSSNGTFINDNKLGDEEAELHFGDIVKFGVDVVENSRKEVHGCIIACVKLYLPDGREAISIDSPAHRSQYSGEGRISYDDLHRLNLYIQETSQREKVLASKLCSIQNILDATRKNSALCWQSMITEDQLLHRIHSLEKKLSFMEKNVPENVLRNEVLKLLDEKSSYQHTAKEALRKVYQERCDAMQMLAKMESAYTQSDNECALLRDQIMNSKQTIQDVNSRLLHLESEYNEYRDEVTRQQQEAKEREEQRLMELTEKLHERELECKEWKKKIGDLLVKRSDLLDDEEQLRMEKQAIEKLDAAIADMDLDDDNDDDDDVEEDDGNDDNEVDGKDAECVNRKNIDEAEASPAQNSQSSLERMNEQTTNLKSEVPSSLASIFGDRSKDIDADEQQSMTENGRKQLKMKKAKMLGSSSSALNPSNKKPNQVKRVKESTIMKWLNNSDLKKNEGSLDIFKAICNENDEENDEDEEDVLAADNGDNHGTAEDSSDADADDNDYDNSRNRRKSKDSSSFMQKSHNFSSILKNVEQNLKQLEAEIENRANSGMEESDDKEKRNTEEKQKDDVYEFHDVDDDNGAVLPSNGGGVDSIGSSSSYKVLSKNNKKYQLLKSSVNMLREAFNEIRVVNAKDVPTETAEKIGTAGSSPPPLVNIQNANNHSSQRPLSLLEIPDSSRTSCDDLRDLETDSMSELDSLRSLSSPSTMRDVQKDLPRNSNLLEQQLKEYQDQVSKLNEKLQHTEIEAQHTLEIMQVECDEVKQKMTNLNHIIEVLKEDKKALEQVINENKNNKSKMEQEMDSSTNRLTELETKDDDWGENDLADINVTELEREEELITYKERLDEQQKENIKLRNEIATLKLKASNVKNICGVGDGTVVSRREFLFKRVLPLAIVLLAIVVYFITTYF